MRRVLAAVALVLLFAPEALAQPAAGPPVRTSTTQAEIAAQASFGTGYVLALYMAQLARQGTPPSPADLDEAARLYFTNGAAAVGVPSSGPGAAYFRNGAQAMAYDPAQPQAAASAAAREAGSGSAGGVSEDAGSAGLAEMQGGAEDAGPAVAAPAEAVPPAQVQSGGDAGATSAPTPPSPRELEAAVALASQFASPAPAPPPAPACPPPAVPTGASLPPAAPHVFAAEPAPRCPPGPSLFSRIAPALGGAVFGALTVVLWSRPRPPRVTRAR